MSKKYRNDDDILDKTVFLRPTDLRLAQKWDYEKSQMRERVYEDKSSPKNKRKTRQRIYVQPEDEHYSSSSSSKKGGRKHKTRKNKRRKNKPKN